MDLFLQKSNLSKPVSEHYRDGFWISPFWTSVPFHGMDLPEPKIAPILKILKCFSEPFRLVNHVWSEFQLRKIPARPFFCWTVHYMCLPWLAALVV